MKKLVIWGYYQIHWLKSFLFSSRSRLGLNLGLGLGLGLGFGFFSFVFFSACSNELEKRDGYRSYREPVFLAENEASLAAAASLKILDDIQQKNLSLADVAYSNIPAAWEKKDDKGLRFANFSSKKTNLEISLVSFPGDVGGLEANVARWMRQLGLLPEAALVSSFASALPVLSSDAGLPYVLVDFGALIPSSEADTILVAILRFSDETLFVKIQGKKKLLELERAAFISFTNSFYEVEKG